MSSLQHMDGSQDKFSSYSKIVANASNMSLLSSFTESDVGGSRQADNRDTSEDCRAGLTKEQHYYRQPSTSRARSPSAWSDNDTVQSSASSDGSQPKKPYSPYETAVSRQSPEVHNKNSYNTLFQKVGMNFYNRRTEDTPDGSGSPNGLRADDLSRHGSEVSGDVKDSTCPDLSLETSIQDGAVFPRGGNQDYMEADDYSNRNRLKTYHCSLCTFTCRKQVDLINHVAVHPDDKPFHCTQCDYKGAKYHHLRNHILTHSERSLLACPQCDYKSYQRGALRVHMRRHSTEKRHGCPHCPYRTHFKGNLKLHLRVHTGEKPYACPVCEFRCTQSGSLKIHMRGHSGEKPYACELCDYRSKHKGNLVMHRRKHTGDKPYQCDKCSYKAAQRMGLTKHYKTVHSDAASVPSRESATISPGSIFRAPMLARTESALSNAFTGYAPPLFKNEDVQNLGGQWIDGSKPACQDDVRPPFEVKAEGSGVLYNRQALVPDACSADVTARAINMHDN
ncbi:hypothetical protein HAZT_HAZT002172 [Hyalella azteca]|nr:hypothetical protein HAZT_HAZT002172 [Hyalella azteca]